MESQARFLGHSRAIALRTKAPFTTRVLRGYQLFAPRFERLGLPRCHERRGLPCSFQVKQVQRHKLINILGLPQKEPKDQSPWSLLFVLDSGIENLGFKHKRWHVSRTFFFFFFLLYKGRFYGAYCSLSSETMRLQFVHHFDPDVLPGDLV